MKKHINILVAMAMFLGLSIGANAQLAHTKDGFVDTKAKDIITKAKNKIKSAKSISFVTEIIVKDQEKKEQNRQRAQVLLSKNKYRITVGGHIFYCDGVNVWHHNRETQEVIINNIEKEEDNILNPVKLLENYEKNFRPKFIREEEDGTFVIDFTPKKTKEYHKIRVFIGKDYQIKKLEMNYYDSSKTEYTIEQYHTKVNSADSDFVFDATEKGIEIIDMR